MGIKELRVNKGWTQEDLARHSGLSTRTIQRAESGKSIGSESLKCIAAVFETSIDMLIQKNKMNPSDNLNKQAQIKLNKIENSAIKFAQSLFRTPSKGQTDPLNTLERKAVDYGKSLLSKFKQ